MGDEKTSGDLEKENNDKSKEDNKENEKTKQTKTEKKRKKFKKQKKRDFDELRITKISPHSSRLVFYCTTVC